MTENELIEKYTKLHEAEQSIEAREVLEDIRKHLAVKTTVPNVLLFDAGYKEGYDKGLERGRQIGYKEGWRDKGGESVEIYKTCCICGNCNSPVWTKNKYCAGCGKEIVRVD